MILNPEIVQKYIDSDDYEVFIFELDDVIFPRKDYVLQIYYLFAAFIEYAELQPSAQTLVQTFKEVYEVEGEQDIFKKIAPVFHIPEKYEAQLLNLYHTARLPQKLWMFQKIVELMQALQANGKKLWIVTQGNIQEQLNKIKQLDWNGLQHAVQVFFVDEHPEKNKALLMTELLEKQSISAPHAVLIYAHSQDHMMAKALDLTSVALSEL